MDFAPPSSTDCLLWSSIRSLLLLVPNVGRSGVPGLELSVPVEALWINSLAGRIARVLGLHVGGVRESPPGEIRPEPSRVFCHEGVIGRPEATLHRGP
jgi:hypothetical protein